jgi:RNA polymerase sigma-70 factor (ECF subfamily)
MVLILKNDKNFASGVCNVRLYYGNRLLELHLNAHLDDNLVRACKRGDKTAYAALVKKHYRHVFAMCLGMLANMDDGEDVAQESMLKGLLKIKNLEKADQFESWILQIARNLCIDFLRKKKRTKTIRIEQPKQPPQKISENHELYQAIRRLPQEFRVPLTMFYFDGKNAKTIARKLNISHSGACQKIRTARKQLHNMLTEGTNHEQ